jgi:hypothetical protein
VEQLSSGILASISQASQSPRSMCTKKKRFNPPSALKWNSIIGLYLHAVSAEKLIV